MIQSELQTVAVTTSGPVSVTPEELAQRCCTGDSEAFNELLRMYGDRVYNFLRQMTGNQQDAEDLTQETFLRAYRSLKRFDPERSFETWVFAISRHVAASHFRRKRCTLEIEENDTFDDTCSPVVAAETTDTIAHLWTVARRLKPHYFQALWLHYSEGFEIHDVARIMGRTRVHVKVILHRARSQLAKRLPSADI